MKKIDSNLLFATLKDKSMMYEILSGMKNSSMPYIFAKLNKLVTEQDWEGIAQMSDEEKMATAIAFEKEAVKCLVGEVQSGATKKLFLDKLTSFFEEKFGITLSLSAEWLNNSIEAINNEARQKEREEKIMKLSKDLTLARTDRSRLDLVAEIGATLNNESHDDSVRETVNRKRNFVNELKEGFENAKGFFTGYVFTQDLEQNEQPYSFKLESDKLYLIAAQTGHGKTRMLENLALRELCFNTEEKGKVVYISLEESRFQTMKQLIKIYIDYKLQQFKLNGVGVDHTIENAIKAIWHLYWKNIDEIVEQSSRTMEVVSRDFSTYFIKQCIIELGELVDNGMMLDTVLSDGKAFNLERVVSYVNEVRNQYGVRAVFIDYVQILKPGESNDNLMDLKRTMEALKLLKNDLNVPVVIASQLSRNCDSGVPSLNNSAVAEAHDIVEAADFTLMLYNLRHIPQKRLSPDRDRYSNDYGVKNRIVCRITKSRVCRVGMTQEFDFHGEYGSIFQPLEQALPPIPAQNRTANA
ncbi:MAG: AAA family ATPase [Paludibacteraceae bacterium]|nr:AAA family ATPase [Paludibacteraceae bacterium]